MITWKNVIGYEGFYEVSSVGLVRRLPRIYRSGKYYHEQLLPLKCLVMKSDKDGYYSVGLRKENATKWRRVSRIVSEAFLPNPENKKFVNHKNGNKKCNEVWNLEWASASENELHSFRVLGKKANGRKELYQLDLDGNVIKIWPSLKEATRNGFQKKSIYYVINGIWKHHKGYKWRRA